MSRGRVAQAVETELEGVRTWVMTAEHLTAIALQTGRAKDHNRILQFVESGTLAPDKPDQILARHGHAAWTACQMGAVRG